MTESKCIICFDTFPPEGMLMCEQGHGECKSCFLRFIKSNPTNIKKNGKCAFPECNHNLYSQDEIINFLLDNSSEKEQVIKQIQEEKLKKDTDDKPSLNKTISEMVGIIRKNTIEMITSSCPHCGQVYDAFNGFDGCLTLTCEICAGQFCGLCQKPAMNSKEGHNHLEEEHPGLMDGFFDSPDGRACKEYYKQKTTQYLIKLQEKISSAVTDIHEDTELLVSTESYKPNIKQMFLKIIAPDHAINTLSAKCINLEKTAQELHDKLIMMVRENEIFHENYDKLYSLHEKFVKKYNRLNDKLDECSCSYSEPRLFKSQACKYGSNCNWHNKYVENIGRGGGFLKCKYLHTNDFPGYKNPYDNPVIDAFD
jgi:hypothetical protein